MSKLRDDFVAELQLKGRAPKTIEHYLTVMKGITRYFKLSPVELTQEQVKKYIHFLIVEKKLQHSSVHQVIAALKTFYTIMLPDSLIMKDIKPPKYNRKIPTVLSKGEVERVINATTSIRSKAIVMLLYSSGLRLNECTHLKPHHIESDQMRIRIENGKKNLDRYTALSKRTLEALRDYYKDTRPSEWLFTSRNGNAINRRTVEKIVSVAAQKVCKGKKVHPHTLRHSFGVSFHSLTCNSSP